MAKVHLYGDLRAHRGTVIDQTVEPSPANASHGSVADGPAPSAVGEGYAGHTCRSQAPCAAKPKWRIFSRSLSLSASSSFWRAWLSRRAFATESKCFCQAQTVALTASSGQSARKSVSIFTSSVAVSALRLAQALQRMRASLWQRGHASCCFAI